MGNDQGNAETVRVRKQARPWSGFFLGLLLGLAVAVLLQQAGVWPLDRLLLYGSAGVFALIGILMSGAGRDRAGAFSSIVPLVLAVALIGWGATGIAEVNESGQINGGCTVTGRFLRGQHDSHRHQSSGPIPGRPRREPGVVGCLTGANHQPPMGDLRGHRRFPGRGGIKRRTRAQHRRVHGERG